MSYTKILLKNYVTGIVKKEHIGVDYNKENGAIGSVLEINKEEKVNS